MTSQVPTFVADAFTQEGIKAEFLTNTGELSLAQKDRIAQILSEDDRHWGTPTLMAIQHHQVLFKNDNWDPDEDSGEVETARLVVRYSGQWAVLWNEDLTCPEVSLIIIRRDGQLFFTEQQGWVNG